MHSRRNDKSEAQIATHKELPYPCVEYVNWIEHAESVLLRYQIVSLHAGDDLDCSSQLNEGH